MRGREKFADDHGLPRPDETACDKCTAALLLQATAAGAARCRVARRCENEQVDCTRTQDTTAR